MTADCSGRRPGCYGLHTRVHIILVPLGVAFPPLVLIANFIGRAYHRRADAGPTLVARHGRSLCSGRCVRHGSVVRDGPARRLMDDGDVFGLPFSMEGIFFFLEAIFITIYIYG